MVVAMISSNTLQCQYFWHFSKCLQVIFSQIKISDYIVWVLGCFDSKLLKIISYLLKSVNQMSDFGSHQMYSNVKTVQQRKPNLNFIWFNICRQYFYVPRSECLFVLLAAVQLYSVLVITYLDMKYFSFTNVSIPL